MSNAEVRQRIVARLASKHALGLPCSLCGTTQWTIGHYAALTVSLTPGVLELGGKLYPLVTVICTNCGNTHLVNLKQLGFTEADFPSLRLDEEEETSGRPPA